MTTTARVAAVNTLPLGSILAADAALGATTLAVEDAADFDVAGGAVIIGDTEIVTFSSADDEAGTLALATPLAAAWPADTRVELWNPATSARVVETVAQLLVEGAENVGDSLEGIVDHSLIPFLPEGIRDTDPETGLVGEAVEIEWRGDELVVVNILGKAPVLDGAMIDPDTLPPSGGPTPETPATPAAPSIVGGIGSLFVQWDAITHPNPVTYEVHVSPTSGLTPGPTTLVGEVAGTRLTVRRLPIPDVELGTADSPLAYGTTYYAAIIAKDSVDATFASALSPEGSGSPIQATGADLAVNSVAAENIIAGTLTGDLFAGELLLGTKIATANSGQRVEMDPAGFRLYNSAGDLRVNLPTDPAQDPSFRGRVEADGLTVRQGAQFFSTLNEFAKDSRISLAEQVAAPLAAPEVAAEWDSVQLIPTTVTAELGTFALDPSQIQAATWHPTLNKIMVAQYRPGAGTRVWYYNLDGTLYTGISVWDLADWDVTGLGNSTTGMTVVLFRFLSNNGWYLQDDMITSGSHIRTYNRQNTARRPTLFVDGSNDIYVVEQSTGGPTIFRRVTTNTNPVTVAGAVTVSGVADAAWAPVFGYRGNADFGSARFIVAGKNVEPYRVFGTGGSYQTNETFLPPVTRAAAFWAPSPTNRFYTIGTDGRLYQHTDITWTDPAQSTWYFAQTFYDNNATGGTHETVVGAVRSFAMVKRAKARVTMQQVPYANGDDDPNRWRLYAKRGTAPGANGSGMTLQAEGPHTSTTHTQSVMLTTSGAAPPTVSNFPGATPARLVSARAMPGAPTQPIVDIRGDGVTKIGPIEIDGTGAYVPRVPWTSAGLVAGSGTTLSSVQYMVDAFGNVRWRGELRRTSAPAQDALLFSFPASIAPTYRGVWELAGLGATAVVYTGTYGGASSPLTEIHFRKVTADGNWSDTGSGALAPTLSQMHWSIF